MIGRRLLHYEVVEKLGEGGMGVVYKAHDTHLDRFVAIKVLPPEMVSDPSRKARFVQEAKAASALNHPNIVHIYDIDQQGGVDFIAMEHVAGKTLDQLIPRKGMRLNEALKIAVQIADALARAHAAGIIHRDLKPANIMVDEHGRAKVLDFGLAKLAERVISENDATVTIGTQTSVGTIVGTAAYMSPEQARGEKVDARTDLFAFGAVLYQMVSGKQAFCGPSTAVLLDAILNRQPPTLRTVEPQTPASLEAIVGKALEKDRELRYQSAADVLADLKRLFRETESGQVAAAPLPNAAGTARRRLFFAAAAATLLGVAGVAWFELRGTARGRIEAVAVLPLSGLSADPEREHFAEGMTEALTVELAQIGSFRVIDQGSAAQFRDAQRPVQEAARKLGVDAVVTASVMWADERVRIAAKLVEANTGRYLWAKSYERDLRDVLALQREVAAAIAGEIRAKVTPEQKSRLASARRVDPEAYELYLKGRQTAGPSKESFERKIAYLEESIRKDPEYAQSRAALASTYTAEAVHGFRSPAEILPAARASATRAIELDPMLAEAHTTLGTLLWRLEWDFPAAEEEMLRALAFNPNSMAAHVGYSYYLFLMGRFEESIREQLKAEELSPGSASVMNASAFAYYLAGRHKEAIERLRKGDELEAAGAEWLALAAGSYARMEMCSESMAAADRARKLAEPGQQQMADSYLADPYARCGRQAHAQKLVDIWERLAKQRHVESFLMAILNAGAGHRERAFEWIEVAFRERSSNMPFVKVHPILDGLRTDPRFQDYVRRVGLP